MKQSFQFDPAAALAHLRKQDATLAGLIERVGPFSLEPHRTKHLFDALLRSIVYQQLHGKAAATILARVHAAIQPYGGVTPETFSAVTDEQPARRRPLPRQTRGGARSRSQVY